MEDDYEFENVPQEILLQAYWAMTQYLCENTGLNPEALSEAMIKVEDLVGEEEFLRMELDEVISWIKALN